MSDYNTDISEPLARKLVEIIETLDTDLDFISTDLDPGMSGLPVPPAAVIGNPILTRPEAGSAESEVGAWDWKLTFPVVFYVDFDNSVRAHAQLRQAAEFFTRAVDANSFTIASGTFNVIDARVVDVGAPEDLTEIQRPQLFMPATVQVAAIVI